MALGTYQELQDAIADWLNRLDATDDVTARIPDFITLAEVKFLPLLVSKHLIKALPPTVIPASGETTIPSDLVEPRLVALVDKDDNDLRELQSNTESQQLRDLRHLTQWGYPGVNYASGPVSYAIEGTDLIFRPWGDADDSNGWKYRKRYFYRPAPLSISEPTNPGLTNHPDVWLYHSLVEAAPFLEDEQAVRSQTWASLAAAGLTSARDEAMRGLHGVMQASMPAA